MQKITVPESGQKYSEVSNFHYIFHIYNNQFYKNNKYRVHTVVMKCLIQINFYSIPYLKLFLLFKAQF